MPRSVRFVTSSLASFLMTAAVLAAGDARAQDLAPPPPMDPNAPGGPTNPGLSPPPPMSPGSPGQPGEPVVMPGDATNRSLDQAEQEDNKRNFELFWVRGDLGGAYINMQQLSNETLQVEKASAGGPMFGLAAGLRLVIFVLGARVRYNALSSFNMWQINGELGLKLPVSSFDILIGAHGGYSFVGSLGDAALATSSSTPTDVDQVKIRGWNAGLDLGVDYYVSPMFSVGFGAFGDFLFLNRPPVDKPAGFDQLPPADQQAINDDPLYQKSGTSVGLQLGGALRLGLHFGL